MARDKNTFEKRNREMKKRQKAEEKRTRRQRRKEAAPNTVVLPGDVAPALDQQ